MQFKNIEEHRTDTTICCIEKIINKSFEFTERHHFLSCYAICLALLLGTRGSYIRTTVTSGYLHERRNLHVRNLMQMNRGFCFGQSDIGSAHVGFNV